MARYYSPRLMHFIQLDSFHYMNHYNYGNGDSINNIDPLGHSFMNFLKGVGNSFKNMFSDPSNIAGLIGGLAFGLVSGGAGFFATWGALDAFAANTLLGAAGGALGSLSADAITSHTNHLGRDAFRGFVAGAFVGEVGTRIAAEGVMVGAAGGGEAVEEAAGEGEAAGGAAG
jgi:hypothetical protein